MNSQHKSPFPENEPAIMNIITIKFNLFDKNLMNFEMIFPELRKLLYLGISDNSHLDAN